MEIVRTGKDYLTETVLVGLGTNMGDRYKNIMFGLESLKDLSIDGNITSSPIYETQPWGPIVQEPFLNCVALFETVIEPLILHSELLSIERRAGRNPEYIRWGPRILDLDILLFGRRVIHTLSLIIPHPRIAQRRFVLVPLCDLVPDYIIPTLNITIREALDKCQDESWIKEYKHKDIQ